jgi:rhodanese-related sulfurtransferase
VLLASFTSLRFGELAALRQVDIDLDAGETATSRTSPAACEQTQRRVSPNSRCSALAGERVQELRTAVRAVAEEHAAGLERLARDYLGDRSELETVDRATLLDRIRRDDVLVLDVRHPAEYAAGHIAGARFVPVTELRRRLHELPDDTEIVAYCRGPYCVYADEAVRLLRDHGLKATRLEDGFPEWKHTGLPVALGAD